MRLISFLIIMILNFNLFAVDISQFKNKFAIKGSSFYKFNNNGNIEKVDFMGYDTMESIEFVLDIPYTNTLFFDKINPYNTKELHYYSIDEYNGETNYYTYMIDKDLLIQGDKQYYEDEYNIEDPYDYYSLVAVAIFVDYDKYGKKYIANLINKDLSMYSARYFQGKYVSEDGKSYFTLKRLSGNAFSFYGKTPNYNLNVLGENQNNRVFLIPNDRQIYVYFMDENNNHNTIHLNIVDTDTLIVFEQSTDKVLGFKGIYTKVKE